MRRYLEDVLAASSLRTWACALVYSDVRADAQFEALLDGCRRAGWELYPIRMARRISPTSDLAAAWRMRKVFRDFRPDVVHAHSSKAGAIGRVVASLAINRPVRVYSPHAIGAHLGWGYSMIERFLARAGSDVIVAVSRSELTELVELLGSRPVMRIAWPVIDATAFAPRDQASARRSVGIPTDRPVVLAAGRLSVQKDPLLFAAVIAAVRRCFPDVLGVWVGDGELRQDLEAAALRLGIKESLVVTGWSTDVRPFLAASDVVVMTSGYESFGYVTAEALAMERPVVGTNVAGTVDLIEDGVTGSLFQPKDVEGAAASIVRYLSSPKLRGEAGRRGRRFVLESFSSERLASELESAYTSH